MAAGEAASRRSLLRAGLAGLAGLALGALGRPRSAAGSIGNPIVMGELNDAAGMNTTLTTSSTGTAFQVNQNGTGTALRGVANNGIAGFFTSGLGSGVSGVVGHYQKYGVYGANDATTYGGGAAIRASGKHNHGVVATTAENVASAIRADNSSPLAEGGGRAILATAGGSAGHELDGWEMPAVGAVGIVGVVASSLEGYEFGSGVVGISPGPSGVGVWGVAEDDLTETWGVAGMCYSSSSFAAGVYGQTQYTGAKAVWGYADAATGASYGVFGQADSPSGYGVYSEGNARVHGALSVTGSISKGSGSFKIDHPLDPANKYLYHSFVESPDMKNVYDGVVTLDAQGEATVELPDWFEALNRDFRYQLTPLEQAAPELHVKSLLSHGAFAIGGGRAGQKVSWLLTGIRKDAFANAHRIPIEEAKPEAERGLYLHPAEHGQPKEKGIGADVAAGAKAAAQRHQRQAPRR